MRLVAFRADVRALRGANPSQTAYMRVAAARRAAPAGEVSAGDVSGGEVSGGEISAGDLSAGWTPLPDISPLLACAVVKAEDPRFFTHRGVDPEAIRRVIRSLRRGRPRFSGTSSITQQLARNLYLRPDRTMTRKAEELVLALRIEARLSKPRILEIYLNVIEWGPDIWGCGAAARNYFRASPAELGLFASTFLAVRLPAPCATLAGRLARRCRFEQLHVLHQMLLCGLVTPHACLETRRRVEHLHEQLQSGIPLREALTEADRAVWTPPADADHAALAALVSRAGVEAMAPADALADGYGIRQERAAWLRLRAAHGDEALMAVLDGGDYARLR